MTIHITRPEIEDLIQQRLRAGGFEGPEDVILHALETSAGVSPAAKTRGLDKALAFDQWARNHAPTPPLSDDAVNRANLVRDVR